MAPVSATRRTSAKPNPPALDAALARLLAGELVAFPTETVYGLGADAANATAVAAIYLRKGRPHGHPLIVHVADAAELEHWAAHVPPAARVLAARFWPGPLTLILPRATHVADVVTGGQNSIGLRCPSHPLALGLLEACRAAGIRGLAAPSANRYGHVSPTTAAHVRAEFGDALLVLDGGACTIGIESTIVDLTGATPRVLRPGMIAAADIAAALAGLEAAPAEDAGDAAPVPRVPGAVAAHYAPRTPLTLLPASAVEAAVRQAVVAGRHVAVWARPGCVRALQGSAGTLTLRVAPTRPAPYARALYASLRELDATGADLIVVERPPRGAGWDAIHDRLARAAAGAGRG